MYALHTFNLSHCVDWQRATSIWKISIYILQIYHIDNELKTWFKLIYFSNMIFEGKFNLYGQFSWINDIAMAENKQASIHSISTSCPLLLVLLYLAYPSSFVSVCVCIPSYSMSICCCIFSAILCSVSHHAVDEGIDIEKLNECLTHFFFSLILAWTSDFSIWKILLEHHQ